MTYTTHLMNLQNLMNTEIKAMNYSTFHVTFIYPDRDAYGIADSLGNPLFTLDRYTGEYASGRKGYQYGQRYCQWSDTFYRRSDTKITADMPEHAILCAQAETIFNALDAIYREAKHREK